MKHLSLIVLLAFAPLTWGEIKFECTGSYKVMIRGGTDAGRTFEHTATVYLQNERRPFTLRYAGKTLEVNYLGKEDEYYRGQIGQDFSIPSTSMWIHRMTLEFGYQEYSETGFFSFRGNCEKAKSFKPKI